MPSVQPYREYAMMRGQIVEWDAFVSENDWAKLHNYSEQPVPPKTCAVYYVINKEDRSVTERMCMTTYDPKYRTDFRDLNLKWVSEFFEVEEYDLYQLNNPEDAIIKNGGEVLILLTSTGIVAAVVATVLHDGNCEMSKMTVSDRFTGKGYANLLIRECIQWAKDRQYPVLELYSSTKLENAIALYKKFGFKTVHLGPHPLYKRCNIIMKLPLQL